MAAQCVKVISTPLGSLGAKSVLSGRTSKRKTRTRKTSLTVAARSRLLLTMVEESLAVQIPVIMAPQETQMARP